MIGRRAERDDRAARGHGTAHERDPQRSGAAGPARARCPAQAPAGAVVPAAAGDAAAGGARRFAAGARLRRRGRGAVHGARWSSSRSEGTSTPAAAWHRPEHWLAFAYLVTVLMFARVDLYADRPRRPGLPAIATALFQATVIALVFALANGEHFSSYYLFYGSLFFGTVYIGALRAAPPARHRLAARAGRLPRAGRCWSAPASTSRRSRTRSRDRARTPVDARRLHLARPRARRTACARSASSRSCRRSSARERVQEVIIADPDFPQEKAVELVDLCHRRGVTVHVAPSTMEILIDRAEFVPGQTRAAVHAAPAGVRGHRLRAQADVRPGALDRRALILLSPILLAIAIAVKLSSRGPVDLPLGAPRDGRQAVLLLQVPDDARARRPDPGRPRAAQRAVRARCSRSATTRG